MYYINQQCDDCVAPYVFTLLSPALLQVAEDILIHHSHIQCTCRRHGSDRHGHQPSVHVDDCRDKAAPIRLPGKAEVHLG